MAEPWLSIIGLGEDGPEGLTKASAQALAAAQWVFGSPRHLALVGLAPGDGRAEAWPVPFDLAPVLARRGQRVAVLASGDPFWFGAGGSLAQVLGPDEWRAFPVPGSFSLAAARLGWRLEETACLGLHAAPFARLWPLIAPGWRAILLLRDAQAPRALAQWLCAHGWGESRLVVLERLGGPQERRHSLLARDLAAECSPDLPALPADLAAPLALALQAEGGQALPRVPGLPEALFAHDGQITKAPVRAMTLAQLAPRPGAMLWDLGAGSGSVSVEWVLAGGRACAVEQRPDRLAHIRSNIARFGLGRRMAASLGASAEVIATLPRPDAIFVGGGFSQGLYQALPRQARLVVNAVTLESQALLLALQAHEGGQLLKIDLAEAAPLGRLRGWQAARSLLQWSRPPCL